MLLSQRRKMKKAVNLVFGVILFFAAVSGVTAAGDVDHSLWNSLVTGTVNEGRVDYERVAKDRAKLDSYLASLQTVDPSQLPSDKARLAFWINAYNACVFKGVLDHYPLKSVKDVKGFFDGIPYRIAGRNMTLNQIENAARALKDWRIHFAVVCASASCPPIRSEAYTAGRLGMQLDEQVKTFLGNHRDGMRLEAAAWHVSSIFKWYAKDFVPGKMSADALVMVLRPYLDSVTLEMLDEPELSLKYLPYDWSLNRQNKPGQGGA